MKLKLEWFNITKIVKRSSHSFDLNDNVTIPMIETKELNRFSKKHKNSYAAGYILTYLGIYKKFTKKL